jgi:RimJ/RimL family protein N-acetyltransferase
VDKGRPIFIPFCSGRSLLATINLMENFQFENLKGAPKEELILLSDFYFDAKIIDSPRAHFTDLSTPEQEEIISFYRSGKFLKILKDEILVGFIGHGVKQASDTIVIFYILLPAFRGKRLFSPIIEAFAEWCVQKYPGKKFFRANTEKSNIASIKSLQGAGFEFLEEKMEGPDDSKRVPFFCFQKALVK